MTDLDPEYEQLLSDATAAAAADDVDPEILEQLHSRYLDLVRGGNTPTGLPYPSPTDPLAEGADAIRALAEAIDVYTIAWSRITGKPATFPPSPHTHAADDVNWGTFVVARIPHMTSYETDKRVYLGSDPDSPTSGTYAAIADDLANILWITRGGQQKFAVDANGVIVVGRIPVASVDGTVPIGKGGTGGTTAAAARNNLGLGTAATVDTTTSSADSNGKVPAFNAAGQLPCGTPASSGQAANKGYVDGAVAGITADADRVTSAAYSREAGANRYTMWMDGNRWIGRSSSSRRFKSDIRAAQLDVDSFLGIPVQTFHRDVDDDGVLDLGAIAEDVADAGLDDLVTLDDDGQVDGIREHRLSWYLLAACQQLRAEVSELRGRLEALEAR